MIYSVYDSEEEEEEKHSSEQIIRIPAIYVDKTLKVSAACWNSKGNVFFVTSHVDQHLGPCNHNAYVFYFKLDDFNSQQYEKNYFEVNVYD